MPEICIKCERVYRVRETGRVLMVMDQKGDPVYLYDAEVKVCPECNHQIVSGYAREEMTLDEESKKFPFRASI